MQLPSFRRRSAHAIVGSSAPMRSFRSTRRGAPGRTFWQTRAWDYCDAIPAVLDVHLSFAGLVSRVPWHAALRVGDNERVDLFDWLDTADPDERAKYPGLNEAVARSAEAALERVRSRDGSPDAIKRALTVNLSVAGECSVLVDDDQEAFEEWFEVLSVDEVRPSGVRGDDGEMLWERVVPGVGGQTGTIIPADRPFFRVWDPHPRHGLWAISRTKAAVDAMEEFLILAAGNRARARSRLAQAGVLIYDRQKLGTGRRQGAQTTGGGAAYSRTASSDPQPTDHPVFAKLAEGMMRAIESPEDPAAVVPLTLGIDGDPSKVLQHLGLDVPEDARVLERMEFLLRQFSYALPLPLDMILDVSASNHWTAWFLDDQAAKVYVDPIVRLQVDAVADQWVRPVVVAAFPDLPRRTVDAICVGYDLQPITVRPNRVADVAAAYDAGVAGPRIYREVVGIPEEDAPTDEERDQMIEWRQSGRSPSPPGEEQAPPSGARARTAAVLSRRDLDRLAATLERIDSTTGTRIGEAARAAVADAIRAASSRLRRAAQASGRAGDLTGIGWRHVGATLGATFAETADVPVDDILQEELAAALASNFDQWVSDAQRATRQAIRAAAVVDVTDDDEAELVRAQDDDRAAAWTLMLGMLLAASRTALYADEDDLPGGELVPASTIRRAMARAGGTTTRDGLGQVLSQSDLPVGGIATGQRATGTLTAWARVRVEAEEWVWGMYGTPRQPFLPHERLHGTTFQSPEDPALENLDGGFPYVAFYFPGDHDWCRCGSRPVLVHVD